jgi:hypothetical protein
MSPVNPISANKLLSLPARLERASGASVSLIEAFHARLKIASLSFEGPIDHRVARERGAEAFQ